MSALLCRPVTADNVCFLLEKKLSPLGVLVGGEAHAPPGRPPGLLAGPRFRGFVVPSRVVRAVAHRLQPLFRSPVVAAAVGGLVGFDAWLFVDHGVRRALLLTLLQPSATLFVLVLAVLGAVAHELGHASGCSYGGARPGRIGIGLHLLWPTFFTEVTDSYRLSRAGRLRTDLGGVYFNCLFSLVLAEAYRSTGFEPLLVAIVLQHVQVGLQFLPFLRLDGYFVISDLAGVPDLASGARSSLAPIRGGRPTPGAAEVGVRTRVIVSAWIATTVAVVAAVTVLAGPRLPALVATERQSIAARAQLVVDAVRGRELVLAAVASPEVAMTAIPAVGVLTMLGGILRRLRRPPRRRRDFGLRPL